MKCYSYALDCTNRHRFFTFRMEELGRKGAFSLVRIEDGIELMMPTRKVFMDRHAAHLAGRRSVSRISASAGTGNATHPAIKEVQGGSLQTHPRLKDVRAVSVGCRATAANEEKRRSFSLNGEAVMHSLRPLTGKTA